VPLDLPANGRPGESGWRARIRAYLTLQDLTTLLCACPGNNRACFEPPASAKLSLFGTEKKIMAAGRPNMH